MTYGYMQFQMKHGMTHIACFRFSKIVCAEFVMLVVFSVYFIHIHPFEQN